jgi:hypothetical protein
VSFARFSKKRKASWQSKGISNIPRWPNSSRQTNH